MGRSIQDNLHLICEVLEGIKDGTETALINLDQSKAFDRVIIGFWRLFWRLPDSNWSSADGLAWCTTTLRQWCRWTESVWRSSFQGCPLLPLLYVLTLAPQLQSLRDEEENLTQRSILFAGPLTAKGSVFVDDIIVFVFHHLDVKAVKKAVAKCERIAGAKVNFDKSECLLLAV